MQCNKNPKTLTNILSEQNHDNSIFTQFKILNSNPPIVSQAATITQAQSNQTSQLPSLTTSTGKLDLANVMKLCGIMDDEDFMDTDEMQLQPPPPQCTTSYDIPTSLNAMQQPNDSDGRPNALYLDGTRQIDENSRWLTIPCVQNTDMTNNRVSNVPAPFLKTKKSTTIIQ